MLSIVILICAMNVSHADCQPDTAVSVTRGPRVQSEVGCGLAAQGMIASTVLLGPDEYLKISCVRSVKEQGAPAPRSAFADQ
ncbi:MAG: hypothetical protein JO273_24910 [Methylobacteriaceae bacterium]|nr:hypothetical protein [Methylobacteriaceae bacterium]